MMVRKTQEEINYWFQDNTIKSALELSFIQKELYVNNLDIPNNIIINKNGSTYNDFAHWYWDETKISKYPTTYEECCEFLGKTKAYQSVSGYKTELLEDFQKILICRDAYWKMAGDEMGLDKPWEPDWNHINRKFYCIYNSKNNIVKNVIYAENKILAFPIIEMRDAFYNNFKDLIESCKTLL